MNIKTNPGAKRVGTEMGTLLTVSRLMDGAKIPGTLDQLVVEGADRIASGEVTMRIPEVGPVPIRSLNS